MPVSTRILRYIRQAARLLLAVAFCVATSQSHAMSFVRDAEIEATLKRMSAPIFRAAGMSPESIKIFLVNDKSLNAFVIGRNMVFHTGLLEQLESPEELLGVIAHETGHIAGGHGIQRRDAVQNAQGPVLLGTILGIAAAAAGAGGAGAAIIAGSQTVAQRSILAYTRGQESAADQAAISYLEAIRVNPEGMLVTLERLKAVEIVTVGNPNPYTLTHPLSSQRIALLRQRVKNSRARDVQVSTETRYWHTRMRAKLQGFLDNPIRSLQRTPSSDSSESATLVRAVAYHRSLDLNAALREVDALLNLRPDDAYYHELKGQILFESGSAPEAARSYERAVALAPNEPLLLVAYGRALLSLSNPEDDRRARDVLIAATREEKLNSEVWRNLSQAESRLGNELGATLATAEFQALRGSLKAAERNAKYVQKNAPTGSPSWIRASDIIATVDRAGKKR